MNRGADLPSNSIVANLQQLISTAGSSQLSVGSNDEAAAATNSPLSRRSSLQGSGPRSTLYSGLPQRGADEASGAFGDKAAAAASSVATAIMSRPGATGRASPIKPNIHQPSGRLPPPDSILCPISGGVMKDPVLIIPSGHTYDRTSVELLLKETGKAIDPKTGVEFESKDVVPNIFAKDVVQDWFRRNPDPPPLVGGGYASPTTGGVRSRSYLFSDVMMGGVIAGESPTAGDGAITPPPSGDVPPHPPTGTYQLVAGYQALSLSLSASGGGPSAAQGE